MIKKVVVFFLILLNLFFLSNFAFWSWEEKLSVKEIKVISLNKLELIFNNDIFVDKELYFFLKHWEREEDFSNTDDEWKILAISDVKKIDINWNKIYLFPEDKFKNNEEYEIVIISVTDINKNTIEYWLDWAIKFTVPADFEEKQKEKQKEKRKKILEKRNYRKNKMNKVLWEIRKELYYVSDIEFETTMEVEEALKIREKANRKKQEYQNQLEKDEEDKKMEEIRKRKLAEERKKTLENRKKKIEEKNKKNQELARLKEIERLKLEKEKNDLQDSLDRENIKFDSGTSTEEENLEWRSIDKINLAWKELEPNQKADDLPEAWTKEYLILIFSLMMGWLFFYYRKEKKA